MKSGDAMGYSDHLNVPYIAPFEPNAFTGKLTDARLLTSCQADTSDSHIEFSPGSRWRLDHPDHICRNATLDVGSKAIVPQGDLVT